MYTFSPRLKLASIIAMVIGVLSFTYGLVSTPSSVEDVKEIMTEHHHDASADPTHTHENDEKHLEHALHQLQNKPWSALYVSVIFFLILSLGATFFVSVQYVGKAGWSILLFRVMEAVTSFVPYISGLILVVILGAVFHWNHIFHWMADGISDPASANYDEIIAGKTAYLNVPFFLIRVIIYFVGWSFAGRLFRKYSVDQDFHSSSLTFYNKNFRTSAIFLVFFAVTSSTAAWDLIMSIDTHWFSTLFGWYVFAGMFVTGVTTIAIITNYLRSRGYLEMVNDSHLHDLAKFMFAISIFWAYLFFSQFMLIWYSNIPEEVTYYMARFEEYKTPFFTMLILNFVCPLIILMNSDYKRIPWFINFTGVLILIGHWLDVYVMIMPGTVGNFWNIGVVEIGCFIGVAGWFTYVVMSRLARFISLVPKGNPYLKESKNYHY